MLNLTKSKLTDDLFLLFVFPSRSQMVLIETVVTSFVDEFPLLGVNKKIRFLTTLTVAIIMFFSGLAMTTQVQQTL